MEKQVLSLKEKPAGGGSVDDGALQWSTRQANLFYKQQNNKFSLQKESKLIWWLKSSY